MLDMVIIQAEWLPRYESEERSRERSFRVVKLHAFEWLTGNNLYCTRRMSLKPILRDMRGLYTLDIEESLH
jgi:hypothetical protein